MPGPGPGAAKAVRVRVPSLNAASVAAAEQAAPSALMARPQASRCARSSGPGPFKRIILPVDRPASRRLPYPLWRAALAAFAERNRVWCQGADDATRPRRKACAVAMTAVLLLAGCGSGSFIVIGAFEVTGQVAVADLDGDGRLDVVAVVSDVDGPPPHRGRVRVWLQRPGMPGGFTPSVDHEVGPDPTALHVADVDGDGMPDLVVMSSHASAEAGSSLVDTVTVLRADPAQGGRFLAGAVLHAGARLADIAVADFDGDGGVDIAFTSYGTGGRVGAWWNRADARGTFGPPLTLVATTAGALIAADIDADGRPDLVYGADDQVWALRRDPASARAFSRPSAVAIGALFGRLAAADLDRDGLVDLVLSRRDSTDFGSPGAVLTLRNDPSQPGQFTIVQTLATRLHPHDLVVSDVDGNGWPDIVTTGAGVYPRFFDDIIDVFLDRHDSAAGTMAHAVETISSGTTSGWWIAAGDLDGDGRPEILMPRSGSVLLWRQDPARAGGLARWVELR